MQAQATRQSAETVIGSWEQAARDLQTAQTAYGQAEAALGAAYEAAAPHHPPVPDIIKDGEGRLSAAEIRRMEGLPTALRARLIAAAEGYAAEREQVYERFGVNAAFTAETTADLLRVEAEDRLMAVPAPDLAALSRKLDVLADHLGCCLDDPEWVRKTLTLREDDDKWRTLMIARDLRRLAGISDPGLNEAAWNPEEFVCQFLACHEGSWSSSGSPAWEERLTKPGPAFSESMALWETLSFWQKTAVRQWLATQPRPDQVKNLERHVRECARAYADPQLDLDNAVRCMGYTPADAEAVKARIGDLFRAHGQWLAAQKEPA